MFNRFYLSAFLPLAVVLTGSCAGVIHAIAPGHLVSGELADGAGKGTASLLVKPQGALMGKTVTAIAARGDHTLALCSDGTLAAWGYNGSGQLGDGSTTDRNLPVRVEHHGVLKDKVIKAIATGENHSLALCSDGTVAAWGGNIYGSLGDGTTITQNEPVLVKGEGVLKGKTVTAIAAGGNHSLALCSDGTVAAWGYNVHGELGDGSTNERHVPVLVNKFGVLRGKTVTAIAAGGNQSLALCSDGAVASWGHNGAGELGEGGTNNRDVPVLVKSSGLLKGKTITAIAAGWGHSMALCSDGTVAAWGYNYGRLGDGTEIMSGVPRLVKREGALKGKTVTAIAGGRRHSLALCADGTLAGWGANWNGQLGDGTYRNRYEPVLLKKTGELKGRKVIAIVAGDDRSMALCADGTLAAW